MQSKQETILGLDDFVVVPAAQLKRLVDAISKLESSASDDGCEEPYVVADGTHVKTLVELRAGLSGARTLAQSLRRVDPDPEQGNDPILVVLPPGISEEDAVCAMDEATSATARETRNGATGDYFEVLQEKLASTGLVIQGGIELLPAEPWDGEVDIEKESSTGERS